MFELNVFREQMYCIEESTCDIVGTFRRPGIVPPFPLLVSPLLTLRYEQSKKTKIACNLMLKVQRNNADSPGWWAQQC